jgi:drug/metabolite transporter (DMT)-like permease
MVNSTAILLGVALGSAAAIVLGLFLLLTRAARRVRNIVVIGVGYVVIGSSAIGSALLLLAICDRLGIGRHSSQHYAALYAYAISYACGCVLAVRGEIRWRRSVGLDDTRIA